MRRMKSLALTSSLVLSTFLLTAAALAENWPGWRGPRGDGTSLATNLPRHWDGATNNNILWKVRIPGEGHASPIVWKDRIFLVTCLRENEQRALLCLDRQSGETLWKRNVLKSGLETKHKLNSYASSTPVTDGQLVYVSFLETGDRTVPARNVSTPRPTKAGEMVIAAYDFSGNQQWLVRPGEFASVHGYCSNPVLHKDLIIVNGDHDGNSYILALQKNTGQTVWKTPRDHKTRSYVTPLIRNVAGKTQMVFSGSEHIISLNPDDGSRYWSITGPTEQFVASMVFDGQLFYMAAGYPTYHVMGIRPDGNGDVTQSHVAWHVTNARCYVPSPVLVGNYLLVADDRGTANCFETSTGERLWQERLGMHYSASLIAAEGLAYFLSDDGIMTIVRPGPELEIVAENSLNENCYASPAISASNIFLRAEQHLYCIQQ